MWEIYGHPIQEILLHEGLHCIYSLLFLLAIYFVSLGMCWLKAWDLNRIISTSGSLLLGFLVCAVLVSHYCADEIAIIKIPWIS